MAEKKKTIDLLESELSEIEEEYMLKMGEEIKFLQGKIEKKIKVVESLQVQNNQLVEKTECAREKMSM